MSRGRHSPVLLPPFRPSSGDRSMLSARGALWVHLRLGVAEGENAVSMHGISQIAPQSHIMHRRTPVSHCPRHDWD